VTPSTSSVAALAALYEAERLAWLAVAGNLPGSPSFDAVKWDRWVIAVKAANARVDELGLRLAASADGAQ
jgi:hypothetical protein